ncbi:hypothetical protein [Nostoc sp. 'Lobaria pulmonaria (5183) cyanobiont']|uniref:hypothetical protein n=1 Tax=Nostoc sp. 'Lobaria pulmonaria (5183) cyanobiont' TaxID=1618022 RepID=UPI000D0C1BBC|nr:hypothetical protein NLP_0985 [Nostoc sp. 'Lobaria pulmonaria (5183) cyanobiont']
MILETAAIAVGTIIATKALEKTTEKVTETLLDKTGKFLVTLKKQSPHTVVAIEKAPEQPLDYQKAVLEVELAAKANPEVAQAAKELVEAAKAEPNPKLAEILAMPNLEKLADKIGQVVMPGGTGNIQNQSF